MVPVVLGIGATEGSSGGCTAGARTRAGVVTVILVMLTLLGTGTTEGSSGGGTAEAGGVVAVIPVMLTLLGTGATEGSSGCGTAKAGVITVIPVMLTLLGTGSTKGSSGSTADEAKRAGLAGAWGGIVTIKLGMPVKGVCPGSWGEPNSSETLIVNKDNDLT